MTDKPLSKVEQIKLDSEGLYGPVADEIESGQAAFSEASIQVLKHHGTYQQDDRDKRAERRRQKLDKDYKMMVRTKTAGGAMTPGQYILCDDLASKYGQDDLRITSRQGFQFHGILKGNLRALIHDLHHFQRMTTLGACGDVVRNVMCSPVADVDARYAGITGTILDLSERISTYFLPKTNSYIDLWLDDEKVSIDADGNVRWKEKRPDKKVEEPVYGERYLPRKFKIGMATDFDNSVDVYTQDVGIIVLTDGGRITGYEILAGGGLGHSHSKQDTYARLGSHLACVRDEAEVIPVVEAIVKVQRDFGNRDERHQARMKYTIDRMGLEAFRDKVQEYYGKPLPAPTSTVPSAQPDFLGWGDQADGRKYVGLWVENGRVRDFDGGHQFKSGLRRIVEAYQTPVRLTPHHNIILCGIAPADVPAIEALLAEYRIPTHEGVSAIRRREMACPALPLCGLALSEAERVLPDILSAVEAAGLEAEDIAIRMTGCPNSCARPETAEIGIIGRGPNKYHLYAGADRIGSRMNTKVLDDVTAEDLPKRIAEMVGWWRSERADGEPFGDWAHRIGESVLAERLASASA